MSNRQTTLTGEIARRYADERLLRDLYLERELSLREIATMLECDHTTVRYYLQQFGIRRRENGNRSVRSVPFCTRPDGYECWRIDHRAVLVHRLLAVAEWGFEDVADSIVHHRSAIRWDNRPSNLQLFESDRDHMRHHARPEISDDQQTLDEIDDADEQLTFDDF